MKIGRQIAEKILSHCSKCGVCPVAKLMDAQMETERVGQLPAKKTLRQGVQSQSPQLSRPKAKLPKIIQG